MKVKEKVEIKKKETGFYCPECGEPIDRNEVICPYCKAQLFY